MNRDILSKKGLVWGILFLFVIGSIIPTTMSVKLEEQSSRISEKQLIENSAIALSIDIPAIEFGSIETNNGEFSIVEMPDEGFTTTEGQARLPVLRRVVEIPFGGTPEIIVNSVSWETTSLEELNLPHQIVPVQSSVQKIAGALEQAEFLIDDEYYAEDTFHSFDAARIVEVGEIRGHRFALVEIHPIQYKPTTGELKVMSECEIQIDIPESDMTKTAEMQERYASYAFDQIYRSLFVNYDSFENGHFTSQIDDEGYLIIVYDNFYEEILPLAIWKQNLGYTVTVTNTSDIPGGPSTTNIKNYIEEAYTDWDTPPSYVLLVGDVSQIPTYYGQSTGTAADLYYVTITTPDYTPDIFIGRFPASQESHVVAMVDKTIYYEVGNFPSNAFIKRAAFMASNDNYMISEGTHNYVISTYLIPHMYKCDKLYCHSYSATTQQVINALNSGRSLAVYSGHGSTTSWSDGPYFSQSNVNSLTNQGEYPFVCSHACLTGQFTVSECFGETWLRAANKAALAFWGSSTYTYWDEDDILEKKMFSAWWDDGIETIGGMTDMGLYYLYVYYGGSGLSRYYFECYNVLGDPSVRIWSDNPPVDNQPDPNQSFITLTSENYAGLTTCPAGDGTLYNYVKATVKNSQGDPIQGIPAGDFDFTVTAVSGTGYFGTLSCTFIPVDLETDVNGEIRFQVTGDTPIAATSGYGAGAIAILAEIQTVGLNDNDDLPCCSYDLNLDGKVDLNDFSWFSVDFGSNRPRSDFNWDGNVDLSDFGLFAVHFSHNGY